VLARFVVVCYVDCRQQQRQRILEFHKQQQARSVLPFICKQST
jgi:hypothetical protein